jgi:hypothetical protein
MRSFFIKASILLLVLSGIIMGINSLALVTKEGANFRIPIVLHFFNLGYYLFTLFSHQQLIKSNEKPGAAFTTVFMGSVTLKLLLTMAALGIWLYFVKENRAIVGIGVFPLYIAYTILEVVDLQKTLRK